MRKKINISMLSIFTLIILVTLGCTQEDGNVINETSPEKEAVVETAPDAQDQKPSVVIEVGERSPAFPGAKAHFSTIKDGDVLEDSNVSVVVEVESYELGVQTDTPRASEIANSAQGQHAHIILDNEPYFADYEDGVPFDIGTLDEGAHTVLVFPSRSYHESVKADGSIDIVNFYVGKEEGEFMLDKTKPTIIYSRPKGKYEGKDTEKIMLDFYLINAELGEEGYKAKYTVRENTAYAEEYTVTMTEWNPAFVTGLTSGEYIITLELLDKEGNLVPGAFNSTERSITVVTD